MLGLALLLLRLGRHIKMGGAMKFLKAWAVLALTGSAAPALAQSAFLNLDPNATVTTTTEGSLITPSSSNPQPSPAAGPGFAHTNVHIFAPAGMPAITSQSARPTVGPPISGYFYETPQSIACVYKFVTPAIPGCSPNATTVTLASGSRIIAIVDAFHAPHSRADLTTFSLQFGLPLPNPATYQVVYAASDGSVNTNPPPYDPGWEMEISLDTQWAHAMAPNARIILVEALSNADVDLLGAVKLANNLVAYGGAEISMSWGSPEFPSERTFDSYFTTPGVVYFASTGDSPGTSWPSVSANVVAVGGTSLSRNPETGAFFGEATWSDGGGGPSEFVLKPGYQGAVKKLNGVSVRGTPDIALDANPNTGVWVYVTNANGWNIVGGTSLSSPLAAGLVNSIGHFNASSAAELTTYYKAPARFNDILQGTCGPSMGYWAGTAWDYCTGLGSFNDKARQ